MTSDDSPEGTAAAVPREDPESRAARWVEAVRAVDLGDVDDVAGDELAAVCTRAEWLQLVATVSNIAARLDELTMGAAGKLAASMWPDQFAARVAGHTVTHLLATGQAGRLGGQASGE